MVDDDQVGALGSTPGPVEETAPPLSEATAIQRAGLALGRYLAPQRLLKAIGHEQLAPFTGLGAGHPDEHFGQHAHLVGGADTALSQHTQPSLAKVVAPSLEYRRPELKG